jgi:HK97 family phage major capsid protein
MATALLETLVERRQRAVSAAREILERYADGARMSAEDQSAYQKADEDSNRLGKRIMAIAKSEKEDRELSAAIGRMTGATGHVSGPSAVMQEIRSDIHGRVRNTRDMDILLPEVRTAGLLDTVTSNQGIETVPTDLARTLYEKFIADSAILSADPMILRTDGGNPLKLPRLTALGALGMTDARRAQAATIVKTANPAFDQVSLDAYKYAQIMEVTRELIEDGTLDIERVLGMVLGRNLANYVGYDLLLGSGSGQPNGLRTAIPAGQKVSTVAGGLWGTLNVPADFDKFYDVMFKLPAPYRKNGKWLVNDASIAFLRKAKMANVYAWEPSNQAGQPDRFLGYPILSDPNLVIPAASAGVTAIFADFSMFVVRLVRDLRVEWSTEYAWDTDIVAVKAVMRIDSDILDTQAVAGYDSIA